VTWGDALVLVALGVVIVLQVSVFGAIERTRKSVLAVARRLELHEQISQGRHAEAIEQRGAVGGDAPPRADT